MGSALLNSINCKIFFAVSELTIEPFFDFFELYERRLINLPIGFIRYWNGFDYIFWGVSKLSGGSVFAFTYYKLYTVKMKKPELINNDQFALSIC